ncbi:hypothetical protein RZS08_04250, partial [Arthrospira platensis SPKY1]|nr:hypothetical protein [Arthrospira platensis SPKY1]
HVGGLAKGPVRLLGPNGHPMMGTGHVGARQGRFTQGVRYQSLDFVRDALVAFNRRHFAAQHALQ